MAISTSILNQPTTAEPHAAGNEYLYNYQTTEATGDPSVIFCEAEVYIDGTLYATKRQTPYFNASGVKRFRFDISSDLMAYLSWDFQAESASGDNHCPNSEQTVYVVFEHYTQATSTSAVIASGSTTTSNTTHAINARYRPREATASMAKFINNTSSPGRLLHDWYDSNENAIDQVVRLTDNAFIYYWNDPLAATGATEIKIQKYQGSTPGPVGYYVLSGSGNIGGTPLKGMFAFACGPTGINALGTGDWSTAAGTPITIDNKTTHYTVQLGNLLTGGTFQATHKAVTFYHDSRVPASYKRVQWMNYRGGIDTFYFDKATGELEVSARTFSKPPAYAHSASDYGLVKTSTEAVEAFVLHNSELTREQSEWISEIAASVAVQECDGSARYEIFVKNDSLMIYKKDLGIEFEIECQYSQPNRIWRR